MGDIFTQLATEQATPPPQENQPQQPSAPDIFSQIHAEGVQPTSGIPQQTTISATPQPGLLQRAAGVLHDVTQIPLDPIGAVERWAGSDAQPGDSDLKTNAKQLVKTVLPEAELLSGGVGAAEEAPAAAEAAGSAVKGAAGAASKVIPSAERAGKAFETVKEFAGELPVDVGPAEKEAIRFKALADAGGTNSKVITQFLKRTEHLSQPLSYNEARDFYSNASRLSAEDVSKLNPQMRRQMAIFTQALGNSIKETADQAGQLENLNSAMKEYRNVKKLEEATDYIKKAVAKAIPYGTAYLAAKKLGLFGGD